MSSRPVIHDKTPFEDIILATWYDIDVGDSTNVHKYFVPDGKIFFNDRPPVVGHKDIYDGYQIRRSRGVRLSRHVITNVVVTSATADRVETVCYMRLYAGDGLPPFDNPAPLGVADEFDVFVRDEDGEWLIAERRLVNLFADPTAKFSEPPSSGSSSS